MSTWVWPRVTVVDHYDGDTIYCDIDLGMDITRKRMPVRLAGINTPELRPLQPGAIEARDALIAELPAGSVVSLRSVGYDKYGPRVDAVVVKADGTVVNDWMVEQGYAELRDYR